MNKEIKCELTLKKKERENNAKFSNIQLINPPYENVTSPGMFCSEFMVIIFFLV